MDPSAFVLPTVLHKRRQVTRKIREHLVEMVAKQAPASIGESVTVSANLLDAKGQILATEEQVEQFNWVGQQLVLPISFDLSSQPQAKATKIEASASISDYGMGGEEKAALPTLNSVGVEKG